MGPRQNQRKKTPLSFTHLIIPKKFITVMKPVKQGWKFPAITILDFRYNFKIDGPSNVIFD